MKIIDRYVFKSFIFIFLFCSVFLYVLYVVGDIFGFLDEILREHIGADSLFLFYMYMFPFVITQIAPVSCLLAGVFTLGNLNMHNEITAFRASGIGLFKILTPVLTGAAVISAALFIINDRVVPDSMRMANKVRYEQLEVGKRGSSKVIRNVAIYGQGNKIIFAKKFDMERNELDDIIIHEQSRTQNTIGKTTIMKMKWQDNKWIGTDMVVYRINQEGDFVSTPEMYSRGIINIRETPLDFINNQWNPQFMSYNQLKKYLEVFLAGSKMAKMRFTVDLYYKLSFPFSCIAMILISAPFTLVTRRGGALIGMAKGILIGLIYVPLVAVGIALGRGGILPPFLGAWLANLTLGGTGLFFVLKR